jgi:hypothetical protein
MSLRSHDPWSEIEVIPIATFPTQNFLFPLSMTKQQVYPIHPAHWYKRLEHAASSRTMAMKSGRTTSFMTRGMRLWTDLASTVSSSSALITSAPTNHNTTCVRLDRCSFTLAQFKQASSDIQRLHSIKLEIVDSDGLPEILNPRSKQDEVGNQPEQPPSLFSHDGIQQSHFPVDEDSSSMRLDDSQGLSIARSKMTSSVCLEPLRDSPHTRQRSSPAVQIEGNPGSQNTGSVTGEQIDLDKEYGIEFTEVPKDIVHISHSLSFINTENKPKADDDAGAHDTPTHQEPGRLRRRRPHRKTKGFENEDIESQLSFEELPRTDHSAIFTAISSLIDKVKDTVESLLSWFSSANSDSDSCWWQFSNGTPSHEQERDVDEQERPRTTKSVPKTSGVTKRKRLTKRQRKIA